MVPPCSGETFPRKSTPWADLGCGGGKEPQNFVEGGEHAAHLSYDTEWLIRLPGSGQWLDTASPEVGETRLWG